MIKKENILMRVIVILLCCSIISLIACDAAHNSETDTYDTVENDKEEASSQNKTSEIIENDKNRDVDKKKDIHDTNEDFTSSIVEDEESSKEEIVDSSKYRDAKTISAGVRSCAFIMNDGTVKFFGDSYSGQKAAEQWKNIVSISTLGYYVVGLNENGEVLVAGNAYDSVNTESWRDIVAVSAGEQYIVALDSAGNVYATGHSADGQCAFDGRQNVRLIATGWRHTVIVDNNDNVEVAGFGADKQNAQIKKLKENNKINGIVKVDAGGGYEKKSGHTVILKSDGTVEAVGNNTYGQCDVGSWEDIVDIAAGDWHTVGLRKDGTVVVTGDYGVLNQEEEPLSKWRDIVAVSAGRGYTIGLKSDGTVVFAGYDHDNGTQLASETSEIKIYPEWYVFNNSLKE